MRNNKPSSMPCCSRSTSLTPTIKLFRQPQSLPPLALQPQQRQSIHLRLLLPQPSPAVRDSTRGMRFLESPPNYSARRIFCIQNRFFIYFLPTFFCDASPPQRTNGSPIFNMKTPTLLLLPPATTITLPFSVTDLLVKLMGKQLVATTLDSSAEERFPFLRYHQKGQGLLTQQRISQR